MTPFDKFIQFIAEIISNFNFWWAVKFFFVLGLALYFFFAIIIVRQVGLMGKTLNGGFASPLKFISLIHLLATVGIFLLALIIL